MIKKFEEFINEDYFSKLASRKDNGDVRKENEIRTNIGDIKPAVFDKGVNKKLSVDWADCVLKRLDSDCDEKTQKRFQLEEIKKMNLNGWRLPTLDEMNEFLKYVKFRCITNHRNMGNNYYDMEVTGITSHLEDVCYAWDEDGWNGRGYYKDVLHAHAVGLNDAGERCFMHMYMDRPKRARSEKECGSAWSESQWNRDRYNDAYFNIMLVKDK